MVVDPQTIGDDVQQVNVWIRKDFLTREQPRAQNVIPYLGAFFAGVRIQSKQEVCAGCVL